MKNVLATMLLPLALVVGSQAALAQTSAPAAKAEISAVKYVKPAVKSSDPSHNDFEAVYRAPGVPARGQDSSRGGISIQPEGTIGGGSGGIGK